MAEAPRVVTDEDIAHLRSDFRGPLFRPGEVGYDAGQGGGRIGESFGAFLWQGLEADGLPALITRPSTPADVSAIVNFAREGGWHPSIRGGGHNAGGFAQADGEIVIDLSYMRNVHVDREKNTVRVGGGATWWDVDRNTTAFGLACVGGAIGHTGVGGFTTGGGVGRLTRKYGLAIDNLVSAEIVTADGKIRQVSPTLEPDLFWAIRGGGGNFGVVTSFEFTLFPIEDVWLTMNWWPVEKAHDVLRFWRDWTEQQDGNVATSSLIVSAPGNRGFDSSLVGKKFVVVTAIYLGSDVERGEEVTRPIAEFDQPAISASRRTSYLNSQIMNDEIANANYGYRNAMKTGCLQRLSDEMIDTYVSWATAQPGTEGLSELIAIGGALNGLNLGDSAFGPRTGKFNHVLTSGWHDPAEDELHITWAEQYSQAMQPFYEAGVYVNYLDTNASPENVQRAFGAQNWIRLREIKKHYDPENFFRRNINVPPAE